MNLKCLLNTSKTTQPSGVGSGPLSPTFRNSQKERHDDGYSLYLETTTKSKRTQNEIENELLPTRNPSVAEASSKFRQSVTETSSEPR